MWQVRQITSDTAADILEKYHILVMDGDCALCSTAARLIARFDRRDRFRIATVQSDLGEKLLRKHGLDPADPESWVCVTQDQALTSMTAVLFAAREIGGIARVLAPLGWLPVSFQDWLYQRIARNRYRIFGHRDMCAIPDDALRRTIL